MNRSSIVVVVLLAVGLVVAAGCARKVSESRTVAQAPAATTSEPQVIQLAVTSDGFVPAEAKVENGRPVKLMITRTTDKTCATEIVIKDYRIKQNLPLNQTVAVEFTPNRTGAVRYACGMDMVSGTLQVQ